MGPAICRVLADEVGTRDADPDAIDQQADDFAAVLYRLGEFLRGVTVFLAAAWLPRTVLERTVVHAALVDVAARARRHEHQQGKEHDATTSTHGNPGMARQQTTTPRDAVSWRGMIAPGNTNLQGFFAAR
jgi:hypothetical protein